MMSRSSSLYCSEPGTANSVTWACVDLLFSIWLSPAVLCAANLAIMFETMDMFVFELAFGDK